jgi:hypothetical protein
MTNKITNKTALLFAIEAIGDSNPEVTAKLQKMVEQIDKKNASPKKLTAQQEKNEVIKTAIICFLSDHAGTGCTCSDLLREVPELDGDSNQHVSALMRALRLEGKVVSYSDKRKTYFKVEG